MQSAGTERRLLEATQTGLKKTQTWEISTWKGCRHTLRKREREREGEIERERERCCGEKEERVEWHCYCKHKQKWCMMPFIVYRTGDPSVQDNCLSIHCLYVVVMLER